MRSGLRDEHPPDRSARHHPVAGDETAMALAGDDDGVRFLETWAT